MSSGPSTPNAPRPPAPRSIAAARPLFAERGFAGVGTEEIVRAAGVTRGALYHQFADKRELFAAVFEQVEAEVTQRTARAAVASGASDPLAVLRVGAVGWLEACSEPEVQRIVLLDGPAVLGWAALARDRHALRPRPRRERAAGGGRRRQPRSPSRSPPSPTSSWAPLDEAALYVATAEDQDAARAEVGAVLDRLLGSLA